MTNKAHSTLTGADLHEPKGAAAASSGQVYVADGAGSGAWASVADPFTTQMMIVAEVMPLGTQLNIPAGTNSRNINTALVNQISGASVNSAAFQFTLPAGTFLFDGQVPARGGANHVSAIQNVSTLAYVLVGTSSYSGSTVESSSFIVGKVTFAVSTTLRLMTYTLNDAIADPSSRFSTETYATIKIWKVA